MIPPEGYYGAVYTRLFRNDADNRVVWHGSRHGFMGKIPDETPIEEGKRYITRFTVKKHDEYCDEKQTLVKRAVFSKALEPAPAKSGEKGTGACLGDALIDGDVPISGAGGLC